MLASLTFLSPLSLLVAAGLAGLILVGYLLLRLLAGAPADVARRGSLLTLRLVAVGTLLLILLNPSNVTQSPGPIERPDMFYLLDASQSMAVGDAETRFEHSLRLMREAEQGSPDERRAAVKLFRFGHRLAAVESPPGAAAEEPGKTSKGLGVPLPSLDSPALAAEAPRNTAAPKPAGQAALVPTDSDTQLLRALRQALSRFGRRPPAGLVLFSDGRARDEAGVEQLAAQFAKLKVPIHVAPVGDTNRGGDVAIVACVVPPRVRRYSEVEVQVFLRSYGYDGQRCEVTLTADDGDTESDDGSATNRRQLAAPVPVTLHDGFQSVGLSFRSDPKTRKLKVHVSEMPDEVSTSNNAFGTEVQIDRTKIRVLYVEGSAQPLQPVQRGERYEIRGPYSDLQQALIEDEDIECVVLAAPSGRGRLQRVAEASGASARAFPETLAELSAYDAIILSDIAVSTFTDQQLEWLERWIAQRGGGLLMVGGQRSFAAGGWDDSPLAQMLPIEMQSANDWLPGTQVAVRAAPEALAHPLWLLSADEAQNREIVSQFPAFFGANRWSGVKPNLSRVLATSDLTAAETPTENKPATAPSTKVKKPSYFDKLQENLTGKKRKEPQPGDASEDKTPAGKKPPATGDQSEPSSQRPAALAAPATGEPAIVVGQYGRGRTMAMAMPITSPWANDFLTKWGEGNARHHGRFWRNAIYWLTESSSIGRRRLLVTADKKFYRPGETISLSATAFDEAASPTGGYKIIAMIEPQSSLSDLESNYSPVRWPEGKPRESGESGPFVAWGEEFDLPRADAVGDKPGFALELPIADALAVGSANQSLRIELTAMEEYTQVDSTSLDIQVLHDPFEQQNPFPNHELLASIAEQSGGRVIKSAAELTEVLRDVPISTGSPVISKTPVWSNWALWCWLLGVLTVEWIWRRVVGLA